MTSADLLEILLRTSAAGSAAALVVIVLSRPLRRWAGAANAYRLWWMVPMAMAGMLLPARQVVRTVQMPTGEHTASAAVDQLVQAIAEPVANGPGGWELTMLALWTLGVMLIAWRCVHGQRRFRAALGCLRARDDGLFEADVVADLPAVVGLDGRIVLPRDFADRFTASEQTLVIAHERIHVARRDAWWNALAFGLCALNWFNPIAWWALRRFRVEQELSCDALVLSAAPTSRRNYGEALLKTLVSDSSAPLVCQWPGSHPLKERIEMLAFNTPNRVRRNLGTLAATACMFAVATAAWAAKPASTSVTVDNRTGAPLDVTIENGEVTKVDGVSVPKTEPKYEGPLVVEYHADNNSFSIAGKDVPMREVLTAVAEKSGRTLEVAPGVDLSATASFSSLPSGGFPTDIAMEVLGEAAGAHVQADAHTIRVTAAE